MMFFSTRFKNLWLALFPFCLIVLFLNTGFVFAAGTWNSCQGPLSGYNSNYGDYQFDCNNSDSNPYSYYCEETPNQLAYCRSFSNSSTDYYDCGASNNNVIFTQFGFLFVNCQKQKDTQWPTILSFTGSASSSQINLSWQASDNVGITRIDIVEWRFSNNAGFWKVESVVLAGTATSYTFSNLLPNETYYYQLYVQDAALNSASTEFLPITTPSDSSPPPIPTLFSPACSSSSCSLSWSASTDTGGSGLGGYRIYRNGSLIYTAGPAATSYFDNNNDNGLSPSTSYSYYIIAFDNVGNSSLQSNTVIGTTTAAPDTSPPTAPSGLTATAISDQQINLSWTASTDNVGVVNYRIERCQGSACANFVQIGTATANNYPDSDLSANTTYRYQARAWDGTNLGPYSNVASATTQNTPDTTPPNFIFTSPSDPLSSGTQNATLAGRTTNEAALCAYSTSSEQIFSSMTAMPTTDGFTHSAPITGLADNQSYTYYVKCRDGASPPNVSNDFIITFSVAAPPLDTQPPLISGGQPSGTLSYFSGGSGTVTMSVLTNEAAYCRYSQAIDTDFDSMAPNSLSTLPAGDLNYQKYHFTTLTVSNGLSYKYYVRCQDTTGPNTNDSGYPITFSVALQPNTLPVADLNVNPTNGIAPLQVNATGAATDPDNDPIIECSMDWGDNTSGPCTLDVPLSHTYSNAGNYVITFTVADSRGGKASDIQPVTVDAAPQNQQLPPILGGICAVECDNDSKCGDGFVCSPSRICVPAAALDNGPVRSGGYASLPDDSQNQPADDSLNPADFNPGTKSVKIGLTTDVPADCRFAVDPKTNNGIEGVDYSNTQFMRQFSTNDYISHYTTLTGLRDGSYVFYAKCRNRSTLAKNPADSDYDLYFNIGAPDLLPCVAGEMCPNGAICSGTGAYANKCPPANYTCIPNPYFFKYNIPYMLDVCVP